MPATPQNSRSWVWPILGLAIAGFVFFELLSRRIVYVVPDSYSGLIDVALDNQGNRLWPSFRGVVIHVPDSGLVHVRSFWLLSRWSVTAAREKSGTELPVSILGHPMIGRRLWLMYSTKKHCYRFVGTERELDHFIEQHGIPWMRPD